MGKSRSRLRQDFGGQGQGQGRGAKPDDGLPELVAVGRISGGVSETYVRFRAMPSADEICASAVRKIRRALRVSNSGIREFGN